MSEGTCLSQQADNYEIVTIQRQMKIFFQKNWDYFIKTWHNASLDLGFFVCLFGVLRHMETAPLQVLTHTRHSCPLSSEDSLVCHTYWVTGHPFIMVISEDNYPKDPWHSNLLPSVWQWSCNYLLNDLGLSRLEFENPTFRMRGERSNRLRHHGGTWLPDD